MTALPMSADAVRAYVEMARKRGLIFITPPVHVEGRPVSAYKPRTATGQFQMAMTSEGRDKLGAEFTIKDVVAALGMTTYDQAKGYVRTRLDAGLMYDTGRGTGRVGSPKVYAWKTTPNRMEED